MSFGELNDLDSDTNAKCGQINDIEAEKIEI